MATMRKPNAARGDPVEDGEDVEETQRRIAVALQRAHSAGCELRFVSERRLRRIILRNFRAGLLPNERRVRLLGLICAVGQFPQLYISQEPLDALAGLARKLFDDPPLDMVLSAVTALPGAISQALDMAGMGDGSSLLAPLFVGCIAMSYYMGRVHARVTTDGLSLAGDDTDQATAAG